MVSKHIIHYNTVIGTDLLEMTVGRDFRSHSPSPPSLVLSLRPSRPSPASLSIAHFCFFLPLPFSLSLPLKFI